MSRWFRKFWVHNPIVWEPPQQRQVRLCVWERERGDACTNGSVVSDIGRRLKDYVPTYYGVQKRRSTRRGNQFQVPWRPYRSISLSGLVVVLWRTMHSPHSLCCYVLRLHLYAVERRVCRYAVDAQTHGCVMYVTEVRDPRNGPLGRFQK